MQIEDFGKLTKAETGLIAHLRAGKPGVYSVSGSVPPPNAPKDLHIRASLIRALALKQVEGCPLPERGLRIEGAYLYGDGPEAGGTSGLDLEGTILDRDLALLRCRFPDPILLRRTRLTNLFLNGSELAEGLLADSLEAKGGVFLRNLEAAGEIRLLGAKLGGNLSCEGAKLNAKGKALNASGATIAGSWFWRSGTQSKGAIDLTAAQIGTICDDPTCWPAEVLLHRCRYGAFTGKGVSGRERIDWLSRMKPRKYGHDFWPHPYEECARALREAGHGTDAREVLIEKERLQRKARRRALRKELQSARALRDRSARSEGFAPNADRVVSAWFRLNIARIWDWTLGKSVDYGRRPGKAALWLACLWLLGAFMFARAAGFGEIKPNLPQIQRAPEWIACSAEQGTTVANTTPAIAGKARPEETQLDCFLRQPEAAAYPRFDPLIYSADTLLPIVSLEMQSYWIPDDRKPIGKTARLYLWLHIFAGWGLTLLAVAGFSGLIKTDNTK